MTKSLLAEEAKKRILVLDGAMGTMIQGYKLKEEDYRGERFKDYPSDLKGNNDLLSITQQQIIKEIHAAYFEAGADIVETNTFNSTRISMADYDMEDLVPELNYEAARIAREVADEFTAREPEKPRFVIGSIGPTNKTASLSPDVNNPGYRAIDFDTLAENYTEQARALIEGGVDGLLIETVFDTLNAKAALFAVMALFDEIGRELPIMVSGTITDASGRTLSGQTAEAFLISISHAPLFSVGLNCALGASQLRPYLQILSRNSDFKIKEYLDLGLVNIIGGCCGTGPGHIKAIAELAKNYFPRSTQKEVLI